jgi:hypothetical protein
VSYFLYRPSNQPEPQRLAGAELRASTIKNFKEASRQHQEIESRAQLLQSFLEDESQRLNKKKADGLDNLEK